MRNLFVSLTLLFTLLFEARASSVAALGAAETSSTDELHPVEKMSLGTELAVDLQTATGKTIVFKPQEQESADKKASAAGHEIPYLVLNRNGVPTPGFERTLNISVTNLVVPSSGLHIQLIVETQHVDPDQDRKTSPRIQVWKESRYISHDVSVRHGGSIQFTVTFDPRTKLPEGILRTPTDYYRYKITVSDARGNQLQSYTAEYAFLMENQWRVPLPDVLETTSGAAPNELLIYYCDMVPFQSHLRRPDTQIPRQEVDKYIQTRLIPQMVKAFEIQTNLWDLPWHKEWSNYRVDEDPKTLSVALGGHGTWFHGRAPSLGHAMISIRVDGSFGEYSTLTDGIMSVFHHELFHNQQRNISFHFGSKGNVSGQEEAWELFSEGTAVLASSVGQPVVQFESLARSYLKRANAFIGSEGAVGGGLNKRYKDIPYHTALYWRFLYENCGGVSPVGEDPATGMRVIRHVLETLYKGEIVQINSSTDVAGAFPRILDAALQSTPSCKFNSYEESLSHFARAIYMLRLQNGRCAGSIVRSNCGFIDPNGLYQTPPADVYRITAENMIEIDGAIPSSYGIDLNELTLGPTVKGKTLKLIFLTDTDANLTFNLQVWRTNTIGESGENERRVVAIGKPIPITTINGSLIVEIDSMDGSDFDSLGLIVTRTDPFEDTERTGGYSIRLLSE